MSDCGDHVCLTCGDVAIEAIVESVDGLEARCVDPDGASELVAIDLVGPVRAGDRVLVHAGVALARLDSGGGVR